MSDSEKAVGGRLTFVQGTALYVSAVLGTGVIALPALAAKAAGPASLLAWLALIAISAPLAATFAALGARHPDSGGVSTYARRAFGDRAAAAVGWCFYFAMPPGAAAAALFCGAYVSAALGGGTTTTVVAAAVMLSIASGSNMFGVRLVGRVQLALSGLLVTTLLATVALSLPHAHSANLTPFAPHGWAGVWSAAGLLVWSFAGWEVITHLAADFRDPRRDLPRATAAAVVTVGVIYLAVALAVVSVLGPAAADSEAPLGELLARAFGGSARVLAVVAVLLTLGVLNAYYAGTAKLGAALGRDGALPAWFGQGSSAGEVPRRSLAVHSIASFASLAVAAGTSVGTTPLVLATTGPFVMVYVFGAASATRLLDRGTAAWVAAVVALVAVIALLFTTGVYLLWPLAITAAALVYRRTSSRRRPPVST